MPLRQQSRKSAPLQLAKPNGRDHFCGERMSGASRVAQGPSRSIGRSTLPLKPQNPFRPEVAPGEFFSNNPARVQCVTKECAGPSPILLVSSPMLTQSRYKEDIASTTRSSSWGRDILGLDGVSQRLPNCLPINASFTTRRPPGFQPVLVGSTILMSPRLHQPL